MELLTFWFCQRRPYTYSISEVKLAGQKLGQNELAAQSGPVMLCEFSCSLLGHVSWLAPPPTFQAVFLVPGVSGLLLASCVLAIS